MHSIVVLTARDCYGELEGRCWAPKPIDQRNTEDSIGLVESRKRAARCFALNAITAISAGERVCKPRGRPSVEE